MADIEVTGDALLDLRRCVAHLREALSQSGKTNTSQLDIARLLNETGNVALAYECYPRALGVALPRESKENNRG